MLRYRLRFLLQEIDLRPGDTLLGRSSSCHITMEDPLVSRKHARIRIQGELCTIKDFGSRNGCFVNGTRIESEYKLADGDRIRIGTLELVFCASAGPAREADPTRRTTGSMCRCAECGTPYPAEAFQCPICGSGDHVDEETISGVLDESHGWSLALVAAVLDKALALRRWDDVERMLLRARQTVEQVVAGGQEFERGHFDSMAEAAARVAAVRGNSHWAEWMLGICATLSLVPNDQTTQALEALASRAPDGLAAPLTRLVANVQANGGPGRDERRIFERLESLARVTSG